MVRFTIIVPTSVKHEKAPCLQQEVGTEFRTLGKLSIVYVADQINNYFRYSSSGQAVSAIAQARGNVG